MPIMFPGGCISASQAGCGGYGFDSIGGSMNGMAGNVGSCGSVARRTSRSTG